MPISYCNKLKIISDTTKNWGEKIGLFRATSSWIMSFLMKKFKSTYKNVRSLILQMIINIKSEMVE